MKKVFLIHGFEGEPNGGWRPYVMRELAKLDIYVCALSMPTPYEPVLREWLEEVTRHIERNKTDDIYLVGHSLGGTTVLHLLQNFNFPNLKGVVLVSAPCRKGNNEKIKEFLDEQFDWSKMRGKVENVSVIHGDDDPLVPLVQAEEIAKELNGKLIVIPKGKHLNGSAGFVELPEVVEELEQLMRG